MRTISLSTTLVAAACTLSGTAQAELAGTFGFTDLNGRYDGQSFHAGSLGTQYLTGGDVTDYTSDPSQTATFVTGMIAPSLIAVVMFSMDIDNITASTADGSNGQFEIRDVNGDLLSGSFAGTWDYRFGFGFFDGEITLANYTDDGNGLFEGTGGGDSFETPDGDYFGAISFMVEMPDWFSDATTIPLLNAQADGILLTPSPSSLALLAFGGLTATRRRRG